VSGENVVSELTWTLEESLINLEGEMFGVARHVLSLWLII